MLMDAHSIASASTPNGTENHAEKVEDSGKGAREQGPKRRTPVEDSGKSTGALEGPSPRAGDPSGEAIRARALG